MKKRIMRLLVLTALVTLLTCCLMINANAVSASIWFTDPTVTVGSNVSVVIDVKGDDIGGYEANISYDTTYLSFVGASGSTGNFSHVNNTGVIRIVDYMSSGSAAKMSCTLTFKTKKTGTTKLIPAGCVFTSGGGDEIAPYAVGDSTINIIPVPEASSDATLKGLTLSNGVLNPAFSPSVTEYTANVDFGVTALAVTALKNHNGASVYVSGNEALAVGENTVTVTVTAENGAKKNYTIKVKRGKNPLSTDLTLGEGISAEISNMIRSEVIPKGFELTQITINNVSVNAVIYSENAQPAVYLLGNEKVKEGLYFVDVANMTAKPFEYLTQTDNSMLILDVKLVTPPEGYELGRYSVNGTERDAFVPVRSEEPNHCLVYAIGVSGTKQLYMYDPLENTFQRFGFAQPGEPETTVPEETEEKTSPETDKGIETKSETSNENDRNDEKAPDEGSTFKTILIIIGAIVVVLIVAAVIISMKNN